MTASRNPAATARMTGRIVFAAALGLLAAACSGKGGDAPAAKDGRMPQSQVVRFGAGSSSEGERLYGRECAFCHAGRNTGTIMLGRRMEPDKAELHKRTDLDADYVKTVARKGLVNMPPFSRVEVTDEELDKIAAWLADKGRAR
ncbi:c-type cytochrome [Sphingomonas canadensis]|uniref:C-type cytochrome n=1 Tax=Sphingomonas canadensis TaxID=1219257 RepID=A0ABW3H2H9_9SPHN|nr:cytochrome c [Sphingomonas canadensis]MCW3834440.1 cytochrome c [Sphingomonas canadensis]